ncbi:hypothetical protein NC652_010669 [Populus alba x Populus x berolinensis]|nr:hypothetical protein NC652_010669 [Populus alba x Populus x berolinensis]
MTDSGSQLSSLVSGFRTYYGGGHAPNLRPNKKRLAAILSENSTIGWNSFEDRVRKMIEDGQSVRIRGFGRSIYRKPRCPECMCKTYPHVLRCTISSTFYCFGIDLHRPRMASLQASQSRLCSSFDDHAIRNKNGNADSLMHHHLSKSISELVVRCENIRLGWRLCSTVLDHCERSMNIGVAIELEFFRDKRRVLQR